MKLSFSLPLPSSLSSIQEDTENKIVAVKTMLVILVLSSLTQLALWTVAHCQKLVVYNHRLLISILFFRSKCLSSAVENPVIEFIQLWKLLIFPFVGWFFCLWRTYFTLFYRVMIYFMSFSSNVLLHHSYTFVSQPFLSPSFLTGSTIHYFCH